MKMSEDIKELFEGMYKLKSKLKPPVFDSVVDYKDKKGNRTFFEYASLGAISEAIRLAAHESESGIDFQQSVKNENGMIKVTTMITHISGNYIIHEPFELSVNTSGTPQAVGSVVTYAKRYSLSAVFGIAGEKDDDGKSAMIQGDSKGSSVQLVNGKQLANLNEKVRLVSELAGALNENVRKQLTNDLKINTLDQLPVSRFQEAERHLNEWLFKYRQKQQEQENQQPEPAQQIIEDNIQWGKSQ